MNYEKQYNVPTIKVGGTEWAVMSLSINDGTQWDDVVLSCEVELLECERQFYRRYRLFYERGWFETWGVRRDDYPAVAKHAKQWLGTLLGFQRNQAGLSACDKTCEALVQF